MMYYFSIENQYYLKMLINYPSLDAVFPLIVTDIVNHADKNLKNILNEKSEYQLKSLKKPLKFAGVAIAFFFLLANNCFGQSITWQRIYNGPSQVSNDYGYASCRADGQNIYILGSISNQKIYLLKINQLGDTIWTKIIGNSYSRGRAIVESDSGSCVLTGDIENGQAFAIKVNNSGNIVWQKYYGGISVQINDIINTSDSGYVLCGVENTFYAVLIKIDSNGNLQWYRNFSAGYEINFKSIVEFNNGKFLLTGWKSDNINSSAKCIIEKVDENGIYLWDTSISFNSQSTGGRKIIKYNHGFAISGTIYVNKLFFLRIDTNLSIIFKHIFDSTYQKYDIGGFVMLSPNKLAMNYSQDSVSGFIDGKIAMFDSLGNIFKYKTYTSQRQITFGSITQLADTGFIFCGTINNNINTFRDIYIIKADTMFNAVPIGISYNNYNSPDKYILQQNYPNPFNPVTTIKYEIPLSRGVSEGRGVLVTIKIYDLLGKEVFNINEFKKAGSYEVQFDGANFATGVYFYKLVVGDNTNNGLLFTDTKKMVLLK